jgi:hypothetical protein
VTTAVGAIGGRRQVQVDEHGGIEPFDAAWSLDWWIGGDDRWHRPGHEPTLRQSLVDGVPVVRTAIRVPGGDAVQHVYAVGGPDVIVIDVENESPAPFVLAVVARRAHRVALDGGTVTLDGGDVEVATTRGPSRWAAGTDGTTEQAVTSGAASDEPFITRRDRGGHLEAAFLYPIAHRTAIRFALDLSRRDHLDAHSLGALPDPGDAARGWAAHLDRGLRVDLPDPALTTALRAALAATLLAATRRPVRPATVAALEDWGYDTEAAAAWATLGWRARKAADHRRSTPPRWSDVTAADGDAERLTAVRALLAHEHADGTVTLLADLPEAWRGHPIDVRDAPTRAGPVSYSVRWHGPRPALLWEAPPGVELAAPGLDPAWTTRDPSGDALLAAAVA